MTTQNVIPSSAQPLWRNFSSAAAHPLAVMTSKSNDDMLQFQEPGRRQGVRQLLVKTGVCLVIGSVLMACVWATPPRSVNRMLASNPGTRPSSNASEDFFELLNASGKQLTLVGPGGTFGGGPGVPVVGPCTNTNEVSTIQVCNEGSISVQPLISQAPDLISQWAYFGNWIAPNPIQCYQFPSFYGTEDFPLGCYFFREGGSRWQPCTGSRFNYKRTSHCVGEYRCCGNPLVCERSSAVISLTVR